MENKAELKSLILCLPPRQSRGFSPDTDTQVWLGACLSMVGGGYGSVGKARKLMGSGLSFIECFENKLISEMRTERYYCK